MHARIWDHRLDRHIRVGKGGVGLSLIARLPIEDVVVVSAWAVGAFLLVLYIFADHRRISAIALNGSTLHGNASYSTSTNSAASAAV